MCKWRPRRRNGAEERGQILLLVLVVFLILVLVEGALVTEGYLERRMSANDVSLKQAQQAADAGLEWALEDLYHNLSVDGDNMPLLWYYNKVVTLSSEPLAVSFVLNQDGIDDYPEAQYCIYTVYSTGWCQKVQRKVLAKIRFSYDIIDSYDEPAAEAVKRFAKGRVVYYELLESP